MYNGIGLTTARGSGTNGFVQRNLSAVPVKQKRVEYKTEEDFKKLDTELCRGPNLEILAHARKRQIELKCMEMRELMEEQNYPENEIEEKVAMYRKKLMEKDASSDGSKIALGKDEFGRPIAKDSHEIAQAQAEKNRRFKEALGLPANYVDGSSLEKLGKADAPKPEPKYGFVDEPQDDLPTTSSKHRSLEQQSSSESESDIESKKPKNKKRRKDKKAKKSMATKVKPEKRSPSASLSPSSSSESDDSGDQRPSKRSPSPSRQRKNKEKRQKNRSRSRSRSQSSSRSSASDSESDRRSRRKEKRRDR